MNSKSARANEAVLKLMGLCMKVKSYLEIDSVELKEDAAVIPPAVVQMDACNLSNSCAELRGVIIATHRPFTGEGNTGAQIDWL